LSEVRKGTPGPEVDAGANAASRKEHGNVLARVIGACGRWIVAVIGGYHQQIARL